MLLEALEIAKDQITGFADGSPYATILQALEDHRQASKEHGKL
jgi:hypothetical protein